MMLAEFDDAIAAWNAAKAEDRHLSPEEEADLAALLDQMPAMGTA